MKGFSEESGLILEEIATTCRAVKDTQVQALVQAICEADKVFFVGVGRVLISLQAMVKRLNHLGISAVCVGDLAEPAITERDLLIVGSGSGESVVPVAVAGVAKKFHARVAHIGSNPQSSLAPLTDLFVRIPVRTRLALPDEMPSVQIMSSLFEQTLYILCDSICLMIAEQKNLSLDSLWHCHANLE